MKKRYANIYALMKISEKKAAERISNEDSPFFDMVFDCFEQLDGNGAEVLCYADFFQVGYELPKEFIDRFGRGDGQNEEERYQKWKEFCLEHNRRLLKTLCGRFGAKAEISGLALQNIDVIIESPKGEHIKKPTYAVLGCLFECKDTATYRDTLTTYEEAADVAIGVILKIDRKKERTAKDIWQRNIAVDIIKEVFH